MKRKLLSLTLVLALVLSLVPMGAFAATAPSAVTYNGPSAVANFPLGTVGTFTPTTPLVAGDTVTVTFPASVTVGAVVAADFTFVQADPDGTGTAVAGAVTAASARVIAGNSVTFTLAAGSLSTGGATGVAGTGTVTIAKVATDATLVTGLYAYGDEFSVATSKDTVAKATGQFANQYTSVVSVDKATVTADNSTKAEYTIYTYTKYNEAISSTVYFASSRTTDSFALDGTNGTAFVNQVGTTVGSVKTLATGKAVITMTSGAAGTSKVGFGLANEPAAGEYYRFLNGATLTVAGAGMGASTFQQIATKDVTFTADTANDVVLLSSVSSKTPAAPTANGLDYLEQTWRVQTSSGAPVAGETVTFSASDSALTFNATSKVTDGAGIVKVKVYSTKLGTTFSVDAKAAGKTKNSGALTFGENGVYDVKAISSSNVKVAKDATKTFKLQLLDQMSNVIDVTSVASGAGLADPATVIYNTAVTGPKVIYSVETQPSGASLRVQAGSIETDGYARLKTDTLKVEGKYVVRAALDNGKKVDFAFEVVKQGDVKDMNFSYDEKSVKISVAGTKTTTGTPTLEAVDAAGITKDVTLPDGNIVFSVSDATLASVNQTNGVISIETIDKDDIGKKFNVVVTDKTNKITKSYELAVAGNIVAIAAKDPGALAANKQGLVKVQMVDSKGNVVSGLAGTSVDTVVLSKPTDAIVSADKVSTFADDIKSYGEADIKVNSNKEGTVKLQVIVTKGTDKYSTVVELKFGASAVSANKALVLTIGSTTGFMNNNAVSSDLAPFIKDGRAFVPVSFIAAQLGGTAEFTKNAAGLVDTVTVKSGTTTVTMTIGSTTIKVVKDGKESTVTSDVAPFIKSGRTVLPFRAIAEAMGATVSFGPETGAVEWVKFSM